MLELLKGPFLGLIFSRYVLMALLMMQSVTLLSMLMMLLSTLSARRYQICGKTKRWRLNLNLNYETPKTEAGIGLLIFIPKRLSLVRLTSVITLLLLMWKLIVCWRKLIFEYAGVVSLLKIGLRLFYFLYVFIMSRTRFGVNSHSIVAWMSRNSLLEAGTKSELLSYCNWTRTHNHLTTLAKWLSARLRTKCCWVPVQLQSLFYYL